MLAQRRERWANISPALGQRLVFDRLQVESAGQTNRNEWDGENHRLHGMDSSTSVYRGGDIIKIFLVVVDL